jgi:phage tail-like protein
MRRADWLAQQLPLGMLDDEFLVRFLGIFQEVADTVVDQIDALPHAFEPAVAPLPMVRAMGAWLGLEVDSSLPEALQRRMVGAYGALLPWRGTKRGLRDFLAVLTGAAAVVEDSGGVYPEGESPGAPPHVHLQVTTTGDFSERDLLGFVQAELPASVTYEVVVGGRQIWPPVDSPPEPVAVAAD